MPNVLLAFVGAHSSKSSVYTFRSEKSAVEVGQGNLKLTFSADKIKHANYVNSRSSVCDEQTCCPLSLFCFFPKNSRQLELFWHSCCQCFKKLSYHISYDCLKYMFLMHMFQLWRLRNQLNRHSVFMLDTMELEMIKIHR